MTYYNIIGYFFEGLSFILPVFVLLSKKDTKITAVSVLLCIGCTFFFDYRILGSISIIHILLVIICISDLKIRKNEEPPEDEARFPIYLYILYISIVTIMGYMFKNSYIVRGSIVQNQLRPLVQIIYMIVTYISVISVRKIDSGISKTIIIAVYKTFLILAIIGIFQSIIYSFIGFDILPMRKDFISSSNGLSAVAKNGFLRATAGVGEPKQLAKFLGIGFSLQLILNRFLGYEKIKWVHLIIFLIAIFFTSSTTGFIFAFVGVVFYLLYITQKHPIALIFFGIVIVLIIPLFLSLPVIKDKFDYAESGDEIIGLEDTDTSAVRWLINEPQFLITGVGLSNTVAYANKYTSKARSYINNYPYTLRRGIVYHLAETGIIGLILQLIIMFAMYHRIRKQSRLSCAFIFICIMYFFVTIEGISQFQMLLLALLSNCSECKNEDTLNENITNKHRISIW